MPHEPKDWARICRTQAAWTTDPHTKSMLLELADEYDGVERERAADPPLSLVETPRR